MEPLTGPDQCATRHEGKHWLRPRLHPVSRANGGSRVVKDEGRRWAKNAGDDSPPWVVVIVIGALKTTLLFSFLFCVNPWSPLEVAILTPPALPAIRVDVDLHTNRCQKPLNQHISLGFVGQQHSSHQHSEGLPAVRGCGDLRWGSAINKQSHRAQTSEGGRDLPLFSSLQDATAIL